LTTPLCLRVSGLLEDSPGCQADPGCPTGEQLATGGLRIPNRDHGIHAWSAAGAV